MYSSRATHRAYARAGPALPPAAVRLRGEPRTRSAGHPGSHAGAPVTPFFRAGTPGGFAAAIHGSMGAQEYGALGDRHSRRGAGGVWYRVRYKAFLWERVVVAVSCWYRLG